MKARDRIVMALVNAVPAAVLLTLGYVLINALGP